LPHNKYSLLLRNSASSLDKLLQVHSIAVLNDQDLQRLVLVDIVALHDVLGVANHHQLRLCNAQSLPDCTDSFIWLQVYILEVHDFGCDHSAFGLVHAEVDGAIAALIYFFVDVVVVESGIGYIFIKGDKLIVGEFEWMELTLSFY
jgi:hypothetical protein